MSVIIKGHSAFEMSIVSNIKDVESQHIKFQNIYFKCKSIEDAGGTIFVKRKKGKWIGKHEMGLFSNPDSITYRCSECNHPIYTIYGIPKCSNYCPE